MTSKIFLATPCLKKYTMDRKHFWIRIDNIVRVLTFTSTTFFMELGFYKKWYLWCHPPYFLFWIETLFEVMFTTLRHFQVTSKWVDNKFPALLACIQNSRCRGILIQNRNQNNLLCAIVFDFVDCVVFEIWKI